MFTNTTVFAQIPTLNQRQILTQIQIQTICMQQTNSRMVYETIVAPRGIGSDQHKYLFQHIETRIPTREQRQILTHIQIQIQIQIQTLCIQQTNSRMLYVRDNRGNQRHRQ